MKIEDLKPAWQSFKVQSELTSTTIYDPQSLLELLDSNVEKSTAQKLLGAGAMLVLIFFFCQGG